MMFVILVLLVLGATFYHRVEGWRYLDALYFSSYTLTTVGYGDFVPKTDLGKMFTIVYVFAGVGIALYGLSILSAHFIEQKEEEFFARGSGALLRRHTETLIDKLKGWWDPKKVNNEKGAEDDNKKGRSDKSE